MQYNRSWDILISESELEEKGRWWSAIFFYLDVWHEDISEISEDLSMDIIDWLINLFSDTEEDAVVEDELHEWQNNTEL